jgi:hypothetical protein
VLYADQRIFRRKAISFGFGSVGALYATSAAQRFSKSVTNISWLVFLIQVAKFGRNIPARLTILVNGQTSQMADYQMMKSAPMLQTTGCGECAWISNRGEPSVI